MAGRFKHEDVSAVPSGWKVRTVKHRDHRVRVAFPPGRKKTGSGRLVSILHPAGENPTCSLRSSNPAELLIMGANPPRKFAAAEKLQRQREARERAGRIRAARLSNASMKHGLHIKYSPANQAYFLMWHGTVLRIFQTKAEAKAEMKYLLRDVRESNPAEDQFKCPHCEKIFTAAQVEAGEFLKHMAEHRKARNPAPRVETYQLISAITGKPIRKATKVVFDDGKEVKFIERLPKRKAVEQAMQQHGRNPAELMIMGANPRVEVVHSDNPPVEEIVERFTGAPAEWIDVYNEPHMPRGRYAQLGPLIALYIKPAGGGQVRRIGAPENRNVDWKKYWGGDAPVIVTDTTARQIYFVGGAQDLSECLDAFTPRDRGDGLVELGKCRRIDYEGRKEHVADPDEDQWKHDHGEENGVLPTVLFDTRNKRLLYEGGDYRIDGAWIRN